MLNGVTSPKYYLNTKLLYKIWFSKNPDIFMDELNILRLIRMKTINPRATITLLYSAQCLSIVALQKLKNFAQKLSLNLMDFDSDLITILEGKSDKKLYELARLEIENTLLDTGGNLAAAANIVKAILAVNETLGIYSEFDVHVNFEEYIKAHPVNSPCIINSKMGFTNNYFITDMPVFKSDFFALTYETDKLIKLSPHAIEKLGALQNRIIENYQHPTAETLTEEMPGVPGKLARWPFLKNVITIFFSQPNGTLFGFRVYINNLNFNRPPKNSAKAQEGFALIKDKLDPYANADDFLELIKHTLYINTIIFISGPKCLISFFKDVTKTRVPLARDLLTGTSAGWDQFCQDIFSYGAPCNGLAKAFFKLNLPKVADSYPSAPIMAELQFNDASWLPAGEEVLRQRSKEIKQNVCLIQSGILQWSTKQKHKMALVSLGEPKADVGMAQWAFRGIKSLYSAFYNYKRPASAELIPSDVEPPAESKAVQTEGAKRRASSANK